MKNSECLLVCVFVICSTTLVSAAVRCPTNMSMEFESLYCANCKNYPLVDCAPVPPSPMDAGFCYCLPGYVRRSENNKQCIAIKDCPPTSFNNEEIIESDTLL